MQEHLSSGIHCLSENPVKTWNEVVFKWTHGLECHKNTDLSTDMQSSKHRKIDFLNKDMSHYRVVVSAFRRFEDFIWLASCCLYCSFSFWSCFFCLSKIWILSFALPWVCALSFCSKNQSLMCPVHCLPSYWHLQRRDMLCNPP